MTIGIDASRAFIRRRTGIEEYAYQIVSHLRTALPDTEDVVLYVRGKIAWEGWSPRVRQPEGIPALPAHWRVRAIWMPRFWTQGGLSLEMLSRRRPDVLFIPAHTVPLVHPARTAVTIHGLEYEACPRAYSLWERIYMTLSIRFSCRAARKIISVSRNTRDDLSRLYRVPPAKMSVIHEGFASPSQRPNRETKPKTPYFLFIGRLEERKNIVRLIHAFDRLKNEQPLPHRLVLAGKFGYGKRAIKEAIAASSHRSDIETPGYVGEAEKWKLLSGAEAFLFVTLYEGFGLPVLEAQAAGCPVIASRSSSLPEIAGEGALYADPLDEESLVSALREMLGESGKKDDIIRKGAANLRRFSWEQAARETASLLTSL